MSIEGLRRRVEPHVPVVAAFLAGLLVGLLLSSFVSGDLGSGLLTVGAVGLVGVALATDLAKDAVKRGAAWLWSHLAGRREGRRRIERSVMGQTRVMAHAGGPAYEAPRWVDPSELDHRGYFYGSARSPYYVPLYGNGFEQLASIRLECAKGPLGTGPADPAFEELVAAKVEQLRADADRTGRPFTDGPMVRLVRWTPPVQGEPLVLQAEVAGHERAAAVAALLRDDDGDLRRRYGIEPRALDNPAVCGALGVEVAMITSDGQLVLARRGDAATDYRRQIVVSLGEAMHPDHDRAPGEPGRLDPWLAVARGAQEEFGLELNGTQTRFLALGLELRRMDPDLLGYVQLDYSEAEVRGAFAAGRARDRWETRDLEFIPFEPLAVARLLVESRDFTPASAMNLVFSLLQRFGERDVARAFAR